MTAVPLDVLRALAVEWRREADQAESIGARAVPELMRLHAVELDDVCDHYQYSTADV